MHPPGTELAVISQCNLAISVTFPKPVGNRFERRYRKIGVNSGPFRLRQETIGQIIELEG